MIITVCNLIGMYPELFYSSIKHSRLCDLNVWSSWRAVPRAPEWAELSPDVCPSVGYESCPPPEAPEMLRWEEEQVMLFDIQQPFWLSEVSLPFVHWEMLCHPHPLRTLSPFLFLSVHGGKCQSRQRRPKYGPSWHKPKVNKIGSECIHFTDKPFTTSVVGWIKSQFRPEETTCSSSE